MSVDLEACCRVYSSEAVRWLLGDSLHPGGAGLTSRLAAALDVGARDNVVDVACGIGTSALQLARETGCRVVGVDLSAANVAEAKRRGNGSVSFVQGDAERLPLPDESFDGVLCECSLCLFADPASAAREIARVLRPGAMLAISDVVAEPDRLRGELATALAGVACIAAARPLEALATLLEDAGFMVEGRERHDRALLELLDRITDRLRPFGLDQVPLLTSARSAVEEGTIGYCAVVARRL